MSIAIYRQESEIAISFVSMQPKDIDILIGKNLKRLRKQRGFTQASLGEMIGVDGNVIAQLEGASIGMGKDILARLCNALKINPFEFYLPDNPPFIQKGAEEEIMDIFRKIKEQGVAEEFERYGKFILRSDIRIKGKPRKSVKDRDK